MKKEQELKTQQLEVQKLVRNGFIATTVFVILIGLLFFRSWHLRKKLEKQEAILRERKRISADLHDDIGTGLSKISLLSELVKSQTETPHARTEAEKIASTSKQLLESMSEIIWALNTNNDYLENLVAYIRRYASEYFENSPVNLITRMPGKIPTTPISGEYRRNIFFIVKESLHNILKHARATEAEIMFSMNKNMFTIMIRDNGTGFTGNDGNRFGNGLKNMKNRMDLIRGTFLIENQAGTKITLTIPL
jgi:signal transduction histidine kinase